MEKENEKTMFVECMPMMALRGISVFPDMVLNFDVERSMSMAAVDAASNGNKKIFLIAQRDIMKENPAAEDLYTVGTVCIVKQMLRVPGEGIRVIVEGVCRGKMAEVLDSSEYFYVKVASLPETKADISNVKLEAMLRQSMELFDKYAELSGVIQPESVLNVAASEDPGYVADFITQNIFLKHTDKQLVLEELDSVSRLKLVNGLLAREIDVLLVEQELQAKLQEQLARTQRENVLREQLRTIQAELGEDENSELDSYRSKIIALKLTEELETKLLKEVDRLAKQPFGSSEASVIRNYLDICLELPWNTTTKERNSVAEARKILDKDHFGLEKVKERILEFLAVRQLAPNIKGTILCLVGPPGVGKTSIASSLAKAMGRNMSRISLGGVHDEAEIRGHRKTYVGSMPGRIIDAVKRAGSNNPLILLDEIDKLGSDYRGDPSSALLEALDSEQNATFRDNFLELPFDLSNVFFVTTANSTDTIPQPLLDRMEMIELTSYTDEEKLQIAKRHLLPKQRKRHGLNGTTLRVSDNAIRDIIACYTKESGVRQLEREIASVCRKAASKIAEDDAKTVSVTPANLPDFLGVRKYSVEKPYQADQVGIVNGLAWTRVGGEILEVEVNVLEGSGKLELTGNLGDVMKESAKIAVSYIRSRAAALGIDPDFYKNKDIHIHFPEGAVPKDGPSAGITMTVAMISALTGAPVRRDIAMTGEVTLRGRILPIGGLKEKTMAALRSGIHKVIIPQENEKDLEEIDQTVRSAIKFTTTDHVDKILELALDMSKLPKIQSGDHQSHSIEMRQ
jgi:ATP-dependent Lon protease